MKYISKKLKSKLKMNLVFIDSPCFKHKKDNYYILNIGDFSFHIMPKNNEWVVTQIHGHPYLNLLTTWNYTLSYWVFHYDDPNYIVNQICDCINEYYDLFEEENDDISYEYYLSDDDDVVNV